jgi:hypothetical protein
VREEVWLSITGKGGRSVPCYLHTHPKERLDVWTRKEANSADLRYIRPFSEHTKCI